MILVDTKQEDGLGPTKPAGRYCSWTWISHPGRCHPTSVDF